MTCDCLGSLPILQIHDETASNQVGDTYERVGTRNDGTDASTVSLIAGDVLAAPYEWRHSGPGGYQCYDTGVDPSVVENSAKAPLAGVTKGEAWKSPRGINQIPLVNMAEAK